MTILFGVTKDFKFDFTDAVFHPINSSLMARQESTNKYLINASNRSLNAYVNYLLSNNLIPNIVLDHADVVDRDLKDYSDIRKIYFETKNRIEKIDYHKGDSKAEECEELESLINKIEDATNESENEVTRIYNKLTSVKEECQESVSSFADKRAKIFLGIFLTLGIAATIPLLMFTVSPVYLMIYILVVLGSADIVKGIEKSKTQRAETIYARAYVQSEIGMLKAMGYKE